MIKLAICDDERKILSTLSKMIEHKYKDEFFIVTADSPQKLIEEWKQASYKAVDILITDIQFEEGENKKNGIDFARQIQESFPKTQIIFLSGYLEYATEIFDVSPVYFLLKPVEKEMLYKAIDKCIRWKQAEEEKIIYLEAKGTIEKFYLDEIIYVESKERSLIVHTRTEEKSFRMKLGELEEKLPFQFLRTHQSYLVNMDYISGFGKEGLTLKNNIQIPISRMKYSMVKEKIMMYFMNQQVE